MSSILNGMNKEERLYDKYTKIILKSISCGSYGTSYIAAYAQRIQTRHCMKFLHTTHQLMEQVRTWLTAVHESHSDWIWKSTALQEGVLVILGTSYSFFFWLTIVAPFSWGTLSRGFESTSPTWFSVFGMEVSRSSLLTTSSTLDQCQMVNSSVHPSRHPHWPWVLSADFFFFLADLSFLTFSEGFAKGVWMGICSVWFNSMLSRIWIVF